MAGTTKRYFGNRMSLKVADQTDTTPVSTTIAALKGVELTWSAEHIEAYDMDSILRGDVARVKAKVDVKIKYASFNPLVAEWWQMQILSGDSTKAGDGKVVDTNNVALFNIEGTITDGLETAQLLKGTVSDVYFPSMPLVIAENQWIQHDLSGVGRTILFGNSA